MARLVASGPDERLPSLKGQYVVRRVRGQLVIQKWPRKRGPPTNPTTIDQVEKFREAGRAAKRVNPAEQTFMYQITKGSINLPRDLLYMQFYGRGIWISLPDGRRYYSMASVQDVSTLLDALGFAEGDILVRTEDGWRALEPGPVGYALTSQGPGSTPIWSPGAGQRSITLRRNTDSPAIAVWPRNIPWELAELEDWEGWSLADPETIFFPADATRFSVAGAIGTGNPASNTGMIISLQSAAGAVPPQGIIRAGGEEFSAGFTECVFAIATGWHAIGSMTGIRINAQVSGGAALDFSAGSVVSVTVQ